MPETGVNLISQGQIYQKRLYLLSIIDDGICIDKRGMFAYLIENNLYRIDIIAFTEFAFSSINNETLKV